MASDPNILVYLTSAKTEFEGRAMVAALEAEGIPAKVFSAAARMAQWEIGYTDPIKVMVRRMDVQRAADVLRRTRSEARQIDWATVDVHEPGVLADGAMCETCGRSLAGVSAEEAACPHCGAALLPGEGQETPVESAPRAPFAKRWARMRRIGSLLLLMGMVLPFFSPSMAVPLLGIGLLMIAFGGGNHSTYRPPVPRS